MLRLLRNIVSFSAVGLLFVSVTPGTARAESACGIVDGHTVTSCKNIRDETSCTEKCEPVSMGKSCTTQCSGSCTDSVTTECSGSCETESLTKCTADPTKYECKPECTTHCEASCSGHCKSSLDETACSGHCKAECDTTCEEKCKPLPATETCENKVKTCCAASCTVSENTSCEVACETECSTELKGACTTQCTTTEGAVFCEEQYVEGGVDLSACVDEIEASGTEVEGWIKVEANGSATGPGTEGEGVSCATGGRPGAPASLFATAAVGLFLVLAFRRQDP